MSVCRSAGPGVRWWTLPTRTRHLLEIRWPRWKRTNGRPIPYELQRELGLARLPRSLVCFDISHAQGTDVVASAVWFENARPRRAEYRKFKIKIYEGNDDFRSMHEVVTRYFRRRMDEDKPLPDLAVIDGGKGQLGAARAALDELGVMQIGLISLAKRDEEIFLPGRSDPVRLPRRSPALRMLQQARDEAHRFAITFQRQKRAARTITSELLKIPGVGPTKRRALLHAFGSVQGVREASVERIAEIPGFSAVSARRLLGALGVPVPEPAPESAAEIPPTETPPPECLPPSILFEPFFHFHALSISMSVSPWSLRCSSCNASAALEGASVCPSCHQPLFATYEPVPAGTALAARWDMWRYAPFLPLAADETPVSLGEGLTPSSKRRPWRRRWACGVCGSGRGAEPAGSFKARG